LGYNLTGWILLLSNLPSVSTSFVNRTTSGPIRGHDNGRGWHKA
jgi:hypothetical protein